MREMTALFNVLMFFVAIGILVPVHEFGHFWMARRVGIRVLRFSVGFGKVLWSRRGADGTEYALSAIPLGGYVKLLDEREGPVVPAQLAEAYNRRPVWQRILVLLAGPTANFMLAAAAYWVLLVAGVPALKPVIGEVAPNSIAELAGLHPGDRIVGVGGREVVSREGAVLAILDRLMDGETIDIEVRDAQGSGERQTELQVTGDRRGLTEPGALLTGLGFDFWYPVLPATVGKMLAGSPAERAGLRVGDHIVAVDGTPVADFPGLVERVQPNPGKTLAFTVERGGARLQVPIEVEAQHDDGRMVGRIGVQPAPGDPTPESMRTVERYGPFAATGRAVEKTWDMSVLTVRMIWNVVIGDVSVKNLSGPINIAEYAGFSARQGILSFLSFLAVVSVSLFVLNLLPIPILDGGQIVYQLAELVKGRPLSERAQAVGQQVGILLLLVLMSFAFYNDLSRLFS
jgi:regulator of sigma E protease